MSHCSSPFPTTGWLLAVTVLALASFTVGCQPPASAPEAASSSADDDIDIGALMPIEPMEEPESLAAGVEQLTSLRDTVAAGFAADDVDSIHDQLHSVGNLLECIESLAESSELSDDQKKAAGQAIESLFDAYGGVDAKLHGQEGNDYADVKEEINAAVDTLNELTAADEE